MSTPTSRSQLLRLTRLTKLDTSSNHYNNDLKKRRIENHDFDSSPSISRSSSSDASISTNHHVDSQPSSRVYSQRIDAKDYEKQKLEYTHYELQKLFEYLAHDHLESRSNPLYRALREHPLGVVASIVAVALFIGILISIFLSSASTHEVASIDQEIRKALIMLQTGHEQEVFKWVSLSYLFIFKYPFDEEDSDFFDLIFFFLYRTVKIFTIPLF
jgi:hypothetical protein